MKSLSAVEEPSLACPFLLPFPRRPRFRCVLGAGPLTSSPRLGRGLVTGLLADGVRLTLVLGHAGVHLVDDIRADRGTEDLGEGYSGAAGRAIGADDGDGGSRGHCVD